MYERLFAESGLSLDRLKALLEVGAAGSIVKAADADPVRQSQYSRQIKELEDFFRTRLIERQGKGTRLTTNGRELARISRFFMLGLSNFQRGCLREEQTFRIGANATFLRQFLLCALSEGEAQKSGASYACESATEVEVERRLHDLTLDFGIVGKEALSRPLQTMHLGDWKLRLWVPKSLGLSESKAAHAFGQRRLPLVLAKKELPASDLLPVKEYEPHLVCDSFLDAWSAMQGEEIAGLLPDFLMISSQAKSFLRIPIAKLDARTFHFYLAWNPRLLRLNPLADRKRVWLGEALVDRMRSKQSG